MYLTSRIRGLQQKRIAELEAENEKLNDTVRGLQIALEVMPDCIERAVKSGRTAGFNHAADVAMSFIRQHLPLRVYEQLRDALEEGRKG
jgi:L-serine deaminase